MGARSKVPKGSREATGVGFYGMERGAKFRKNRLFIPVEAFAVVAVARGGFVDGALQVEIFDDAVGGEVVALNDFGLAVDNDGGFEGFGIADGVGEANENFAGGAFFQIVDGDTASHVGGRAVNLRGVFARVAATADSDTRAVVVDDEFATGEACVGVKTAHGPVAGRVDMEFEFAGKVVVFDEGFDFFGQNLAGDVLEGGDERVNRAVGGDGDLGFAVVGEFGVDELVEAAGEDDLAGEKLGGFGTGVANHDSLVASAAGIDALGDFWGLLDNLSVDFERVAGNAVDDFGDIDFWGGGGDFAGYEDNTVATTGFGGNAGVGVFC